MLSLVLVGAFGDQFQSLPDLARYGYLALWALYLLVFAVPFLLFGLFLITVVPALALARVFYVMTMGREPNWFRPSNNQENPDAEQE